MSDVQPNHPLAHRIPDAAKRLGVGRTTMYDLINSGQIRTIHIGTVQRVPESELQRFLQSKLEAA